MMQKSFNLMTQNMSKRTRMNIPQQTWMVVVFYNRSLLVSPSGNFRKNGSLGISSRTANLYGLKRCLTAKSEFSRKCSQWIANSAEGEVFFLRSPIDQNNS